MVCGAQTNHFELGASALDLFQDVDAFAVKVKGLGLSLCLSMYSPSAYRETPDSYWLLFQPHYTSDGALRFLFVAAEIWRHAGRAGVSYSYHYQDQGLSHRLMNRVQGITPGGDGLLPVLKTALN